MFLESFPIPIFHLTYTCSHLFSSLSISLQYFCFYQCNFTEFKKRNLKKSFKNNLIFKKYLFCKRFGEHTFLLFCDVEVADKSQLICTVLDWFTNQSGGGQCFVFIPSLTQVKIKRNMEVFLPSLFQPLEVTLYIYSS